MKKGIEINGIETEPTTARCGEPENGGISCTYSHFSQPDLPGIDPAVRTCQHCGGAVPVVTGMGRPEAFCSAPCRKAHGAEQRRAWRKAHRPGVDRGGLVCRECGAGFAAQPVVGGRVPGFCSPECRGVARSRLRLGYRLRRTRIPTKTA